MDHELELTVRVRNNRLLSRRRKLGLSQFDMAWAASVPHAAYMGLETLKVSPLDARGRWTSTALALAGFHDVDPGELFPDAVLVVSQPVIVRTLNAAQLSLETSHAQRVLAGPARNLEQREVAQEVQRALARLPDRERIVLSELFGVNNRGPDHGDLRARRAEIAAKLGISVGLLRVLEDRAIRRMGRRFPRLRELLGVGS